MQDSFPSRTTKFQSQKISKVCCGEKNKKDYKMAIRGRRMNIDMCETESCHSCVFIITNEFFRLKPNTKNYVSLKLKVCNSYDL
jgi:hypothetical protein